MVNRIVCYINKKIFLVRKVLIEEIFLDDRYINIRDIIFKEIIVWIGLDCCICEGFFVWIIIVMKVYLVIKWVI